MANKKVFVLDTEGYVRKIEQTFRKLSNTKNIEMVIHDDKTRLDYNFETRLPEDYDVYFVHVPLSSLNALTKLKRSQPWSKVLVRTSMGNDVLDFGIRREFDGTYTGTLATELRVTEILDEWGLLSY